MILIDWSEQHPDMSSRDIAILQSTYGCKSCGGAKEIGKMQCAMCEANSLPGLQIA